jgi:hypothetical protein
MRLDDLICQFKAGLIEVELEDSHWRGETHWRPNGIIVRREVAVSEDRTHFFDHYFGVLDQAYR